MKNSYICIKIRDIQPELEKFDSGFFINTKSTIMLEIKNKVINKDGQAVKNKVTYAVHYVITNRCIYYVQCTVSATDRDNNFVQIGFIRKEGAE